MEMEVCVFVVYKHKETQETSQHKQMYLCNGLMCPH